MAKKQEITRHDGSYNLNLPVSKTGKVTLPSDCNPYDLSSISGVAMGTSFVISLGTDVRTPVALLAENRGLGRSIRYCNIPDKTIFTPLSDPNMIFMKNGVSSVLLNSSEYSVLNEITTFRKWVMYVAQERAEDKGTRWPLPKNQLKELVDETKVIPLILYTARGMSDREIYGVRPYAEDEKEKNDVKASEKKPEAKKPKTRKTTKRTSEEVKSAGSIS